MICPLCDRELPESEYSDHHLIPKVKGGKDGPRVILHRICHNKLHSLYTEAQLAAVYNNIEILRQQPEIISFVKFLSKKPPNYYENNKWANTKRR